MWFGVIVKCSSKMVPLKIKPRLLIFLGDICIFFEHFGGYMLEAMLDFICNMEDIPYGSVHSNGILDQQQQQSLLVLSKLG
jgi:hypothetical protein